MSASLSLMTLRSTLDREEKKVAELRTELLIDLEDGTGTQFLAGTCYGEAVLEARRVGEDLYILEVRPDLRLLLYRQLRENYRVYRLFRFAGDDDSRVGFSGEVFLRFRPSSYPHERSSAIRNHIADATRIEEPREGFFDLVEHLREAPVAAAISLELDPVIETASPVVFILPEGATQDASPVILKAY